MSLRALAVTILMTVLSGCGVADTAPAPENRPRPAECPSMQALAPNALALLDNGRLPAVRSLLADRLSDDDVAALIEAALQVVERLSRDEIQRLLAVGSDPRLRSLIPVLADVLRFLAAEPADAPRAGLYQGLARVLRTCEGATILNVLAEVAGAPELPAVLTDLGDTLALPVVQDVLAESGGLGRRGVTALLCNIAANLLTPDFEFDRNVRAPLGLIPALPTDEPPLRDLLDGLSALLAPSKGVLPALSDLMCCEAYGVSQCAAVPPGATPIEGDPVFTWLIYDLFTTDAFDVQGLLADASELVADPTLRGAVAPLGQVVRQLADDPDLRATLTRLVVTILEPGTIEGLLPDLILLLEAGGVEELLAVIDALGNGCAMEAP